MKTNSRLFSLLACASLLLTTAGSWARMAAPQLTPVDRLLKSAEAYAAAHPEDAEAYYTLGRIHYLAFSMKQNAVPAFPTRGDGPVSVVPEWRRDSGGGEGEKPAALESPSLMEHADKAQTNFKEAMRLDPKNGLYALGLASVQDEFRTWMATQKNVAVPAGFNGLTAEKVRAAYGAAFKLAMVEDSKTTRMPMGGTKSITAYEAAAGLIRLAKEAPGSMTEEDKADVKTAEEAQAKFTKLPRGPISPMVFSSQPAAHLDEMLDPARIVDFDLRGYGPRDRWPWVKPELGLLVWDPMESGEVKSAQQLFGSYTFEIFRRNGYDAMAALDDNADGVLSGAELEGMSVWFDRDSDGRSTVKEVTPLRELGVESISVIAATQDGVHPMNPRGLKMKDGRVLPTWDWMVEPVR